MNTTAKINRNPHALVAGQLLWYVPKHGNPHYIEIKKIGREYATANTPGYSHYPERVRMTDLVVMNDSGYGYADHGRCYLTREQREVEIARQAAWSQIFKFVQGNYNVPSHLTAEALDQIAGILEK